jgi:hypothetical protein
LIEEYIDWRSNFASSIEPFVGSGGSLTVPEPHAIFILLAVGAAFVIEQSCRTRRVTAYVRSTM